MTVHAALHYNRITSASPQIFYFSFVGTRARHGEEEEEGEGGREGGQGMTRLVKAWVYGLMGRHVHSVNYRYAGGK